MTPLTLLTMRNYPFAFTQGAVDSNATTFIPYAGPGLTSDTDYAVSLTTAEGLTVSESGRDVASIVFRKEFFSASR